MSAAHSRAIIDLSAYAQNLRAIRDAVPPETGILAVVKADAYGLGMIPIAQRAVAEGVSMLGVAHVSEGIALRKAGITAPVLIMVQPFEDSLAAAVENDLRITVSNVQIAEKLGEIARGMNKVVPVHCEIDTGMGRQGFHVDTAVADMLFLTRISHIDIEGIFTHFPSADDSKEPFTAQQLRQFRNLLRQVDKEGIPYELAHASNSAGIVTQPTAAFDMVRPGIMTYGVWPADTPRTMNIAPVVRWETKIALLKDIQAESTVGYGRTYTTKEAIRTAVLPVGYADGYMLALSNRSHVLIRGQKCPVRGRVSMNHTVVEVGHVGGVSVGDTAVLIGSDGGKSIAVEELAHQANTIPYEILTGIGRSVERVYLD
ncbi:MAG: alanine racemase [Candidatus Hydrogenedentota bacterium]